MAIETNETTTEAQSTELNSLERILQCAELLAGERADLAGLVAALSTDIEQLKAKAMPHIAARIKHATAALNALEERITAHPEHFERPRSMTAFGIKFGWAKGKGSLVIADAERTLKLIRKHLPEKADVLIATVEQPVKDALIKLPADDLKRIGCEIKGTGDRVFIKPAESELDKQVKALVAADLGENEET